MMLLLAKKGQQGKYDEPNLKDSPHFASAIISRAVAAAISISPDS
jgi:hypothetical protein